MHGNIQRGRRAAIASSDNSVGENLNDGKPRGAASFSDNSVSDDSEWFPRAAKVLLAPKPGLVLDLLTDCGERNGDRYASGAVKLPSGVMRHLLRGKHGRQWLNAIMDGSDAEWWVDYQRAERVLFAVEQSM